MTRTLPPLARLVLLTVCLTATTINRQLLAQTGPCCVGTTCTTVTFASCTASGGTWQAFGVCTRDLCATPRPCCNGTFCFFRTPGECGSAGGTLLTGTVCSPNPCSGACCLLGNCSLTSSSACGTSGGTWTQFGTCSPNPCLGPCCDDGVCTITVQSLCTGEGAWTPGGAGTCSPNPCAAPTCEFGVTGSTGGGTTAVARVGTTGLLVARGAMLELYDLSDPNFPAPFSPPRRFSLPDAAIEMAVSAAGNRAFLSLADGGVLCVTIVTSPQLLITDPVRIGNAGVGTPVSDIEVDGDRVFVPRTFDQTHGISSDLSIYERLADGTLQRVGEFEPLLQNFKIDKVAKVGNTLWLGLHEFESSVYAIEGWDVTNPAAPNLTGAIVGFADLNGETEVTGLQAIGNRLLLSFYNSPSGVVNRLRAADVTNPASPAWRQTVDLPGEVHCMATTGNQLRLAVGAGIQTWNTADPANLALLGTLPESALVPEQIAAGTNNDYIAVGRHGLQSATFTDPGAPQMWSTVATFPAGASFVRQSGNITVVFDYEFDTLRVFDYTRAESQQTGGTIGVSIPYIRFLELTTVGSQLLACIGSDVGGQLAVYDVTNPQLPVLRSTLANADAAEISCTGSRLYVLSRSSELKVFDLSNPAAPALLSTTPFGGSRNDYICMTSWQSGSTHAVALGTAAFGLWLINATNGAAPQVTAVHTPVASYRVTALTKGPNFLYVSSSTFPSSRLEALNVASLVNPVVHYVSGAGVGSGSPGVFSSLSYVNAPTGRFLIGQSSSGFSVGLMDLNGPLGDGVIHPIFFEAAPLSTTGFAQSANGSRVLIACGAAGVKEILLPQTWAPGFSAPADSTRETCQGASVAITVQASASPAAITYQWFRAGNPAVSLANGPTPWGTMIAGATTPTLTISNIHARENATFYYCVATNSCGSRQSDAVTLSLCIADFNCSGAVSVQDIFDFLAAYFAGNSLADINGAGGLSVQDIFDFLAAYFAGCP